MISESISDKKKLSKHRRNLPDKFFNAFIKPWNRILHSKTDLGPTRKILGFLMNLYIVNWPFPMRVVAMG